MAKRSVDLRLSDMVEAYDWVESVLGDLSLDAFENDWQRHRLVQRGISSTAA